MTLTIIDIATQIGFDPNENGHRPDNREPLRRPEWIVGSVNGIKFEIEHKPTKKEVWEIILAYSQPEIAEILKKEFEGWKDVIGARRNFDTPEELLDFSLKIKAYILDNNLRGNYGTTYHNQILTISELRAKYIQLGVFGRDHFPSVICENSANQHNPEVGEIVTHDRGRGMSAEYYIECPNGDLHKTHRTRPKQTLFDNFDASGLSVGDEIRISTTDKTHNDLPVFSIELISKNENGIDEIEVDDEEDIDQFVEGSAVTAGLIYVLDTLTLDAKTGLRIFKIGCTKFCHEDDTGKNVFGQNRIVNDDRLKQLNNNNTSQIFPFEDTEYNVKIKRYRNHWDHGIHKFLDKWRVNPNREFFTEDALPHFVYFMKYYLENCDD